MSRGRGTHETALTQKRLDCMHLVPCAMLHVGLPAYCITHVVYQVAD